jgi:parallel beta-helix repeat protein
MPRRVLLLSAAVLALVSPAAAAVDPLKPATDALWLRLKSAKPGDVVKAGPGPYGVLYLPATAEGVTLTSADHAHPALLAGIGVNGQTGLTLSHLEVAGPVVVSHSKRVTLDTLTIHGTGSGIAVLFRFDEGGALNDTDIYDMGVGIAVIDSQGITLARNKIHDITADAIDSFGSGKVAIVGNKISNITEVGNGHPDGIQFAGSSQKPPPYPTDDILVDGNDLRRGKGAAFQGIFGGGGLPSAPYTNVRITNNLVMSDMYNGIALVGMVNPVISGNYVQGHVGVVDGHGAAMGPSIMLRASEGGTIIDNVAPAVSIVAPVGRSPAVKANRVPKLAPSGAYIEAEAWRAMRKVVDLAKTTPADP